MKSKERVELELKRLESIKLNNQISLNKGEISFQTYINKISFYDDKIEVLKWVLDK